MKVSLTQSGGWAGLCMACTVDTSQLPAEEARTVENAVASGDLFQQPEPNHRGADVARYVLEVETAGGTRKAAFDDIARSENARKIVETLRPLCRPVPLRKGA